MFNLPYKTILILISLKTFIKGHILYSKCYWCVGHDPGPQRHAIVQIGIRHLTLSDFDGIIY